MRRAYQTDLSDAEWSCLEPHLPAPKANGRPRLHNLREILDAVFYVLRSGCAWRLLPHDFPPWKTVYHYFRFWRLNGTWERIHAALRKRVRVRLQRNPQPSAGIVDSRSIKTTGAWAAKSAALSRRQEGQGPKAPPPGAHAGFGARSAGSCRTDPGSGGHQAPAGHERARASSRAPLSPVAGGLSTPARTKALAGCRRFRAGPPRSLGTPRSRPPRR